MPAWGFVSALLGIAPDVLPVLVEHVQPLLGAGKGDHAAFAVAARESPQAGDHFRVLFVDLEIEVVGGDDLAVESHLNHGFPAVDHQQPRRCVLHGEHEDVAGQALHFGALPEQREFQRCWFRRGSDLCLRQRSFLDRQHTVASPSRAVSFSSDSPYCFICCWYTFKGAS